MENELPALINAIVCALITLNLMFYRRACYRRHRPWISYTALMNPLMILVKIIKLRWIHILSYDQMVSRKINNQTTRCANSI
ncbi:phage holin family protein, partial [Klebsiella oxytoca]